MHQVQTRRNLRQCLVLLAVFLMLPAFPAYSQSPLATLSLEDGTEISGYLTGSKPKFHTSIDTLPINADKIAGYADGKLDLTGIGQFVGSFVSGELIVTSAEGEIRKAAADVVSIRIREKDTVTEGAKPSAPKLTRVSPDVLVGANCVRKLVLSGEGFEEDLRVAVSWNDGKKDLDPSQVDVTPPNSATIRINTTDEPDDRWTVQVRNGEGPSSEPVKFAVKAQGDLEGDLGAVIGELKGVRAKSNGDCTATFAGACANWQCNAAYQCVDLAKRFYEIHYPEISVVQSQWTSAAEFWKRDSHEHLTRIWYSPTGIETANLPKIGDLIFFETGQPDGHVAIVSAVSDSGIEVFQQNIDRFSAKATLSLERDATAGLVRIGPEMTIQRENQSDSVSKQFPVLGWLTPDWMRLRYADACPKSSSPPRNIPCPYREDATCIGEACFVSGIVELKKDLVLFTAPGSKESVYSAKAGEFLVFDTSATYSVPCRARVQSSAVSELRPGLLVNRLSDAGEGTSRYLVDGRIVSSGVEDQIPPLEECTEKAEQWLRLRTEKGSSGWARLDYAAFLGASRYDSLTTTPPAWTKQYEQGEVAQIRIPIGNTDGNNPTPNAGSEAMPEQTLDAHESEQREITPKSPTPVTPVAPQVTSGLSTISGAVVDDSSGNRNGIVTILSGKERQQFFYSHGSFEINGADDFGIGDQVEIVYKPQGGDFVGVVVSIEVKKPDSAVETIKVGDRTVSYWPSKQGASLAEFQFDLKGYRNTYTLDCTNRRFLWTHNVLIATGQATDNASGAEWKPLNPESTTSNAVYETVCPKIQTNTSASNEANKTPTSGSTKEEEVSVLTEQKDNAQYPFPDNTPLFPGPTFSLVNENNCKIRVPLTFRVYASYALQGRVGYNVMPMKFVWTGECAPSERDASMPHPVGSGELTLFGRDNELLLRLRVGENSEVRWDGGHLFWNRNVKVSYEIKKPFKYSAFGRWGLLYVYIPTGLNLHSKGTMEFINKAAFHYFVQNHGFADSKATKDGVWLYIFLDEDRGKNHR